MPAGRPRKQIDLDTARKLAHIHCTQAEIAALLGVSENILRRSREFREVYKKGMDEGRSSLRRKQWAAVEKGNITMMIWLGKQLLGQVDRQEYTGKGGKDLIPHRIIFEAFDRRLEVTRGPAAHLAIESATGPVEARFAEELLCEPDITTQNMGGNGNELSEKMS